MNGFLKIEDVAARVGLSRRTVYSLISDGSFPRPVQLSVRRVAWRVVEIDAWVDAKIVERDRISS